MMELFGEANLTALVGLLGGVVLGLAARLGRFCTLGAIEDLIYGGDDRRMRMWGIAIGTAILTTFLSASAGWIALEETLYLRAPWHPLAAAGGGLIFGYGMAIAGNCGFGALARMGGGDIRSFVIVLVMGLAAYATMSGPLAPLRVAIFPPSTGISANPFGVGASASPLVGIGIGLIVLATALASKSMLSSRRMVLWGAAVGLSVTFGWIGTSWVARTGFEALPVVSHTFSAPLGETMLYVMTSTGRSLSFGVGSVLGVALGAALGSVIRGQFRWEACEDPRELRRQIIGAAMMGAGAVTALGCSIGQGLSAFSVLSISAPLVFAAILLGAALGLRHLVEGRYAV